MKLNCDIGEGFDALDAQIMPYIDMANIACGFHASDPSVMNKTIDLAIANQVTIGAHPGYPDREGFGRRAMAFSLDEITAMTLYQYGALKQLCELKGAKVDYIKPHGALYNRMMDDMEVFDALVKAIAQLPETVALMLLATDQQGEYEQRAQVYDVPLLFEVFSDRAYDARGKLVPRSQEGAVLHTNEAIQQRVTDLIEHNSITTINGQSLPVQAHTLCVHGDSEAAVAIVKLCREVIG